MRLIAGWVTAAVRGHRSENYPGHMRPFLFYAVIRLGLWLLLWWILALAGLGVVLAGVLAALLSMLVSILFLDRLRDAAAQRWKAADDRRAARHADDVDEDAEYEDAVLDEAEADAEPAEGADPAQLPELGAEEPGAGESPDEVREEGR